jgi:hypothetical protein
MNYYLVLILVHLAGTTLALWLTTPVKPPKRWSPGTTKDTRLNSKQRVFWVPIDRE